MSPLDLIQLHKTPLVVLSITHQLVYRLGEVGMPLLCASKYQKLLANLIYSLFLSLQKKNTFPASNSLVNSDRFASILGCAFPLVLFYRKPSQG